MAMVDETGRFQKIHELALRYGQDPVASPLL